MNFPDTFQLIESEVDSLYYSIGNSIRECKKKVSFHYKNNEVFLHCDRKEVQNFPAAIVENKKTSKIKVIKGHDYIYAGGEYIKILSIVKFPEDTNFSREVFFGINEYLVTYKKCNSKHVTMKLNAYRNIALSNARVGAGNHGEEEWYKATDEMLAKIVKGEEELFDSEIFIIVRSKDLAELNSRANALVDEFRRMRFKVEWEISSGLVYAAKQLFDRESSVTRQHLLDKSFLLLLLPMSREKVLNSGYSFYSQSGNELNFEIFNRQASNYNMIITAPPGKGKSKLAQKIMKEEFSLGAQLFIIDRKVYKFHNINI